MSDSNVYRAAVARVLARDDLLQLAHDAEEAIGIAQESDRRGHTAFTEPELFDRALARHLQGADESESPAIRAQHLTYAATIIRFSELVDIGVSIPERCEPVELYERALNELSAKSPRPRAVAVHHEDPTLGVITTYRAIRNLRLAGRPLDAGRLAWQPDDYFHGTGAEPHRGHFEFEICASKVALSEPAQAAAALRESERYWENTRAAAWPTRNRSRFGQALAALAQGDADGTEEHLEFALDHLRATRDKENHHDVQELSLILAFAEYLTLGEPSAATAHRALTLISKAVLLVERIRGRWRVVSRSRSPLSVALQRIYGDIALLVARLPVAEAGKIGLRVAMSAKQTGFAGLMRTHRALLTDGLRNLLDEIVANEDQLEKVTTDNERDRLYSSLEESRAELEDTFSPLVADFVLPVPVDIDSVLELAGTRHIVDFVALPESATRDTNWFRTLIQPDGSIEFEHFRPGNAFREYFDGRAGRPAPAGRLRDATLVPDAVWHGLGQELLPAALLAELVATRADEPIELLISPHSHLCLVPWPALSIEIDGSRIRLIERAVITQTPALTCLSRQTVPPVSGPALVCLVAPPRGVNVERERAAWGLRIGHEPHGDGQVPLARCDLGSQRNVAVPGNLISALEDKTAAYGFVHVAAHGSGTGFTQEIRLADRITAGHALGMRWPPAVLLAVCDMGRVENIRDAEPFGFPIALLAGGAHCVVAGVEAISDEGTGVIAATMVDSLRRGARLDVALRDAQCMFLGQDVYRWALLGAFVH